jgi:hypothetical protein
MSKLYVGNPPSGEGWSIVCTSGKWTAWARPSSGEWVMFKIVGDQRARKANYWIGSNGERFGKSVDLKTLLKNPHSDVVECVAIAMSKYFGRNYAETCEFFTNGDS